MAGADGRPLAETVFHWIDPEIQYWKDPAFALRAPFVHAARTCAEPFYFNGERLASWRSIQALEEINNGADFPTFGVHAAIVAPIHLPGGTIGAVVWASDRDIPDLSARFDQHAADMFCLAQRFVASYADQTGRGDSKPAIRLTPREIQCLKHAAAGCSDIEISRAIDVSVPTVRFHLTNAARKIGASGRSQTVHYATRMGYIGNACTLQAKRA
nr:LuxR C-terminal-related transcriptional regulator [Maricaulis parjimensis]